MTWIEPGRRCPATICGPYLVGTMTHCDREIDHDGLHHFRTSGAAVEHEVHWSGQNDRLTERRLKQLQGWAGVTA